jgi:hypothetical protein
MLCYDLNYSILVSQKEPDDQNTIYNIAGIAPKVSLQVHNYFMYFRMIPYNPLISRNHHTLASWDISNIVFINGDLVLRS